jgi:hypothetical protein
MIPLLAIFNQDASSLPKNNYQSGETTTFLTPFSGEKRHSLSPNEASIDADVLHHSFQYLLWGYSNASYE